MKANDYIKCEKNLEDALNLLEDIYENCDTSKRHENEIDYEINDWNQRFNRVIDEIKCLEEEMVFTFRIED